MKSARSVLRRASLRFRRSSRREQNADASQQAGEVNVPETPETSTANVEVASPVVTANELQAAAAKLRDISSSEDSLESRTAASARSDIDQLLRKQRSELMYELRTIQNSQRPVSKGDQRRHLERFFQRRLRGDECDNLSESSSDGDGASSRQRRNGVVYMEVEGLSRQRPVTQRLQSAAFRHDLENIIRSTLIRQEREVEAALRLRTAGLPGNSRAPLAAEAGAISHTLSETASHISRISSISDTGVSQSHSAHHNGGVPVPPPPPPVPGEVRSTPPAPPVPQLQQHHAPPPPPVGAHGVRGQASTWQQRQGPQLAQQRVNNQPSMPATQPWLLQNRAPANRTAQDGRPQGPVSVDVTQQVQREAIVMEISELVHRELVQETLESDFRGQLEFLMNEHIQTTGADGEQVMNFVRSIPQSQQIRRNDFSHLGIHVHSNRNAAGQEPGAVGGAAVSAAFVREMESLRSRMDELHEMVRMSMEMQLDLQRAIRQEVSAALHTQNGTVPSTASGASPATQPAQEGNCIICLDKEVDAVLYQCGHMCVCLTCGLRLSTMGSHCPMCRAPIRDVIRAYRCQRT